MRNSLKMRSVKSIGALSMVTAAAVSGLSLPQADAAGGKEGANGIVWGESQPEEGTYMVPTSSGEIQGFCIDPGFAYPKQGGVTKYSEPKDLTAAGAKLNADQKNRMLLGLFFGKLATENTRQIRPVLNALKAVPGNNVPTNASPDQVIAGASSVIHQASGDAGMGNGSYKAPGSLSPQAKQIKSLIENMARQINTYKSIPVLGDTIKQVTSTPIKVRTPQGGSKKQRMVVLGDIKMPQLPKLPKLPDIPSIPAPSSTPTPSSSNETSDVAPISKPTSTPSPQSETVTKPVIRTSAGTNEDNVVEKGAQITDTVSYQGLKKGETYTLKGELVDKKTSRPTGDTGEQKFTASSEEGTQDVKIGVKNASSSELVVFEKLLDSKGQIVATHEDVNDQSQTIGKKNRKPEIRTSAEGSTGNKIESGTKITDTVSYTGLEPGKHYRLEAKLMCKKDGSDTGAIQTKEFTADKENGQAKVEDIAVTNPDCNEQVAFEKLYDDNGYLVASHEDITDEAQTVGGETEGKKKTPQNKPAPRPTAIGNGNPQPAPQQPAPQPAPRQVIKSVPSGQGTIEGSTIFNR